MIESVFAIRPVISHKISRDVITTLPNLFEIRQWAQKFIRDMDRQADRHRHHDHVSLISIRNKAKRTYMEINF